MQKSFTYLTMEFGIILIGSKFVRTFDCHFATTVAVLVYKRAPTTDRLTI